MSVSGQSTADSKQKNQDAAREALEMKLATEVDKAAQIATDIGMQNLHVFVAKSKYEAAVARGSTTSPAELRQLKSAWEMEQAKLDNVKRSLVQLNGNIREIRDDLN